MALADSCCTPRLTQLGGDRAPQPRRDPSASVSGAFHGRHQPMLSDGTSRTLIDDLPLYGARVTVKRSNIAVIVLAAGAGTRFSDVPGSKLVADLGGRPVLEHVLAAVRAFGPRLTIVVLGSGRDAVERSIEWAGETRVVNPDPRRGIGSSIRVGFDALAADESLAAEGAIDGTFIVLGDQPQLRRRGPRGPGRSCRCRRRGPGDHRAALRRRPRSAQPRPAPARGMAAAR